MSVLPDRINNYQHCQKMDRTEDYKYTVLREEEAQSLMASDQGQDSVPDGPQGCAKNAGLTDAPGLEKPPSYAYYDVQNTSAPVKLVSVQSFYTHLDYKAERLIRVTGMAF